MNLISRFTRSNTFYAAVGGITLVTAYILHLEMAAYITAPSSLIVRAVTDILHCAMKTITVCGVIVALAIIVWDCSKKEIVP